MTHFDVYLLVYIKGEVGSSGVHLQLKFKHKIHGPRGIAFI